MDDNMELSNIQESNQNEDIVKDNQEPQINEETVSNEELQETMPSTTSIDLNQENASKDITNKPTKKKRRRKRKRIDEYSLENDIKYRGPLSYRGLRILAWAFLIIAQVGTLLALGAKFDAGLASKVGTLPSYLKMASNIMMPLFLIATFATILNGSRTFRSMLMFYGGASILFYLLFIFFHEHFAASIVAFIMETDRATAVSMIDMLLSTIITTGYLSFNVFIDFFLCTLLTFFLIHRPKKVFVGKKLIIFRLFVIIPIAYEIASFVLKYLGTIGSITVSPYLYALLTTKPPMTFVVFLVVSLFIKARERVYRKRGKTHEQYEEFLKTKANSWQFSKFLSIILVLAGFIDLIVYIVLSVYLATKGIEMTTSNEVILSSLNTYADALMKAGVGGSSALILAAPLVTLFSYTRTHKNTKIDMFLPILAIIVIIFVYLEGFVIATKLLGSLSKFLAQFKG